MVIVISVLTVFLNPTHFLFPFQNIIPKMNCRQDFCRRCIQHFETVEVEHHPFAAHTEIFVGCFAQQFRIFGIRLMLFQVEETIDNTTSQWNMDFDRSRILLQSFSLHIVHDKELSLSIHLQHIHALC